MDTRGNDLKGKKAMTINKTTPSCVAPLPHSLGAWLAFSFIKKAHKKHIWNWHERKGSGCACCEMIWHDRAGNDNESKTIPKGLETLVTTTTPLRITFLGSYRRTRLRDRLKARFPKKFKLKVSQEGNFVFGLGNSLQLKNVMKRKMKWQGKGRTWRESARKELKRHQWTG